MCEAVDQDVAHYEPDNNLLCFHYAMFVVVVRRFASMRNKLIDWLSVVWAIWNMKFCDLGNIPSL